MKVEEGKEALNASNGCMYAENENEKHNINKVDKTLGRVNINSNLGLAYIGSKYSCLNTKMQVKQQSRVITRLCCFTWIV